MYMYICIFFICLFLLKNYLPAITMHLTAISVPSRNPNAQYPKHGRQLLSNSFARLRINGRQLAYAFFLFC
jgi:hypothetical protein